MSNADALSRLPSPVTISLNKLPGYLLHLLHHLETTDISPADIKKWTAEDPVLSRVLAHVMHGWAAQDRRQDLKPYRVREKELSTMDGCLLWGALSDSSTEGEMIGVGKVP